MSYKACADCGTKMRESGACPNCHEEMVIVDEQGDDYAFPVSQAFADKVKAQCEIVKRLRKYRESL